jgi:hypothetical protein
MFLGVCGLLFALMVGSNDKGTEGVAVAIGVISILFVWGGITLKKPADQLVNAQTSWDKRWMCARCGHQWQAASLRIFVLQCREHSGFLLVTPVYVFCVQQLVYNFQIDRVDNWTFFNV